MGKDFRFNKKDWDDEPVQHSHKKESEKRQRRIDQKRKDKTRDDSVA